MRVRHSHFLTVLVIAMALSPGAWAHHSRAYFGEEVAEITGELVDVDWRNPHIGLTVRVLAADGSVQSWR